MKTEPFGWFGAAAGAEIFHIIRASGPLSRAEVVRHTGLSKSTVSLHIDRLLRTGIAKEVSSAGGTGKRRLIAFAADSAAVVGVELGATGIEVAVTDLNAEILHSESRDIDIAEGPENILGRMYDMVDDALASHPGGRQKLGGIGIGLPGPVDQKKGYVVSPPIMPGWDRFPVRDRVSERYGVPCFVDNDVNIMALGEARAGMGRNVADFLFVKIGTGIGAGIISEGRIYRGVTGSAGDIGHIEIDGETRLCPCGNRGCLEIVAGGAGIGRKGRELAETEASPELAAMLNEKGRITAAEVGLAASHGDTVSLQLVIDSGRNIGRVLAKLVNFFNPEIIVLGGGVTNLGEPFIAAIREMIIRRSTALATTDLIVKKTGLGDKVGMIGAAALAVDELYSSTRIVSLLREQES